MELYRIFKKHLAHKNGSKQHQKQARGHVDGTCIRFGCFYGCRAHGRGFETSIDNSLVEVLHWTVVVDHFGIVAVDELAHKINL